jgi:hypothetical protein
MGSRKSVEVVVLGWVHRLTVDGCIDYLPILEFLGRVFPFGDSRWSPGGSGSSSEMEDDPPPIVEELGRISFKDVTWLQVRDSRTASFDHTGF